MTFTVTYAWWWVPAAISLGCFLWAFTRDDEGGYLSVEEPTHWMHQPDWFVHGITASKDKGDV